MKNLTPENIKKYSRLHKRCGTSFLLIVMIVSIVVFMFIRVDKLSMEGCAENPSRSGCGEVFRMNLFVWQEEAIRRL